MKKIAVIHEVRPVLEKNRTFMSRSDITLLSAATNKELLVLHRTEKANLIVALLDAHDMRGEDLCSAVREDDALRKVSIIVACSNEPKPLERGARSGANAVVTMPFDGAQLLDRITRLLDIPSRESYRVLVSVSIEGTSNDGKFFGRSGNLSATGMLIETEKELAKGDRIQCSFFLPGTTQIKATGEIVRLIDQVSSSGTKQYGIRFLPLPAAITAAIEDFVGKKSQTGMLKK